MLLLDLPEAEPIQFAFYFEVRADGEVKDMCDTWHAADKVARWYQSRGIDAYIATVF